MKDHPSTLILWVILNVGFHCISLLSSDFTLFRACFHREREQRIKMATRKTNNCEIMTGYTTHGEVFVRL